MFEYVIINDDGLTWSNEHGWCDEPDFFTEEEFRTLPLPMGGIWAIYIRTTPVTRAELQGYITPRR